MIADAFVVVVGLGGVGSHAAHLLLRSGVGRLRLIDFDQVRAICFVFLAYCRWVCGDGRSGRRGRDATCLHWLLAQAGPSFYDCFGSDDDGGNEVKHAGW